MSLPAATSAAAPGAGRWRWWALVAGPLALLLILAALRPLALPDEGRYGEIGRWMAASGDWLVPRLNGLPFFHKPPLLYWLGAAASTLFGATPWSARLAPALHAALMLAALLLAARALGSAPLARRAALMLGCSPAFLAGGQYVNHDMLVAAWIGVAIWCFALAFMRADVDRRKPHTGWALAGFAACALGVLSKGLIGVVLPGLVLLVWLPWTRRFGLVWRLPWLRGLLLFGVLAVPWFVLAGRRYPGMLDYLFGVQQLERYTGTGFNNVWPWWFYLPCLVLLLFPWSLLALYQAVRQVRGRAAAAGAPARDVLLLCWIWIGAIVLFFSVPSSKLIGYMLPVMPPLALLAAAGWDGCMAGRRHAGAWFAALALLTAAALGAASVAAGHYSSRESTQGIARQLACAAAPDDPVYVVDAIAYDLPFYARLTHPPILVRDWERLRAMAGDDRKRELLDAGAFDPELAARVLQQPAAALAAARAAPNAWVVAPKDAALGDAGFRLLAQDGRWALYASPLAPEGPPAAQGKGQRGSGCGGRQPGQ